MFASSPALSALEHPVYDVWVLDCSERRQRRGRHLAVERAPAPASASASRRAIFARGISIGAELRQMLGDELGVEQAEAAQHQAQHEMDQRHLAGVALAAEHALAEEGAAERDAVEPADQLAVAPALDAVGMAAARTARRRGARIGR